MCVWWGTLLDERYKPFLANIPSCKSGIYWEPYITNLLPDYTELSKYLYIYGKTYILYRTVI